MNDKHIARALAILSVILGLLELLQTNEICETLGLEEQHQLVRLFGAREIANGLGIFAASELKIGKLAPWLWGRVAGDALDSGVLGAALSPENPKRRNVALTILLLSPIVALDIWCARELTLNSE